MTFDTIPSGASLQPKPFKASIPDSDLEDFKQLLKLSKIGPKTYENLVSDVKDLTSYGITRQWLVDAKQQWESSYDWRKTEARINSYPNFTVPITDDHDGFKFDIHFVALFSQKSDATPLVLLHGWPGSFLEFLGILNVLKSKYTPEKLPFHVIVPSLPGYGYSSGPSLESNSTTQTMARVIDKLMIGLGFESGYVAQGGDIGSFIARILGANSTACKAVHLNMCVARPGSTDELTGAEQAGLQRGQNFGNLGSAYAREHGTRPATIGLVLSSSPIALLAWIGEKFLQWTDKNPPLDEILDSVTLYWFTESFPRAIYPYREFHGGKPEYYHPNPEFHISKPLGYSWHPKEISPYPKSWVAETGNLVWYRGHSEGGHFAAMERPEHFTKDVEDFVRTVWPSVKEARL